MNVDNICEEIIWYGEKDEKTGKFGIYIILDFDYTLTKISSWANGTFEENDKCFEILKRWEEEFGCKYILETMRAGDNVKPAVDFCKSKGLEFFGIGRNPLQDRDGDTTCKCWGIFNIDDRDVMIPLIHPKDSRPYVNWELIDAYLTPILRKIAKRLPEMEDEILKKKAMVEGKTNILSID